MYKCKLNELCQKRGFESPNYSYIKYGQDHNPLYKPQVIVNGFIYKSSSSFRNHKSADDYVAEIASSHFLTFSRAINETGESSLPILPKSVDSKVAAYDHSAHHSITEPNSIKSIAAQPGRFNLTDTYLLCNKIRVYNCIPDKQLTEGNVVLPIGDGKWTIVSLGS